MNVVEATALLSTPVLYLLIEIGMISQAARCTQWNFKSRCYRDHVTELQCN